MDETTYSIQVEHVEKSFRVFQDKGQSLKERLLFWKRNRYELRPVLRDISFSVKRGEAIGLIGENGCGKSTTLKLLTKILYPDKGSISMQGRVSSLLELGAGFHPDMSGRENIYTNASIFGLTKREIDARLQTIIAFSELEACIDNPVRTYSSGMYMRLAFSVAIHVNADILLIDEILGVGDVNFQQKCFRRLQEIKAAGTTIVIVSHSMEQIEQICDRSIWIDNGKIREEGIPKYVHEHYLAEMEKERVAREKKKRAEVAETEAVATEQPEAEALPAFCEPTAVRMGNGAIRFTDARMLDAAGNPCHAFPTGSPITVEIAYAAKEIGLEGNFGYGIFREDSVHCYGTNTEIDCDRLISVQKTGVIRWTFQNPLLPGHYFLDVAIHSKSGVFFDDIRRIQSFTITATRRDIGLCRLETVWELDNPAPSPTQTETQRRLHGQDV
jgi:ABC-2 type transport system ATP-binding protein